MAKIAIELERALSHRREGATPGGTMPRIIARGPGWTVADVICTFGPPDPTFEERHSRYTIAMVLAGSFQYRTALGDELMTSGSVMLGNHGQGFECAHQHGEGGITPHQYVLRARLRDAANRLVGESDKVLDVAFDSGFGDVSNFNRAFRTEFGVSPRGFRQQCR